MTQTRATTLVVDDEQSIRIVLQRALEGVGYHVLTAASGQEALDWMSQSRVEVMLLDVKMPGLSGFDVLHKVHTEHPETAIIMVTGLADVNTGVEAMKMGAHDYIVKPFNVDDVLIKARRAREQQLLKIQVRGHKQELEQRMRETEIRLQQQFEQLVLSLAREHTMAIEIETLRQAKREKALFSSLPKELQQPKASVEEFVQVLIGMIRSERVE